MEALGAVESDRGTESSEGQGEVKEKKKKWKKEKKKKGVGDGMMLRIYFPSFWGYFLILVLGQGGRRVGRRSWVKLDEEKKMRNLETQVQYSEV